MSRRPRPQLRFPSVDPRPSRPCPSGEQRYGSRRAAEGIAATFGVHWHIRLDLTDCAACRGFHFTKGTR